MSRFDELKKQYPELNITLLDFFKKLDPTKTYKYLPLICKIFGTRFSYQKNHSYHTEENYFFSEFEDNLKSKGVSTEGLTENEIYVLFLFSDFIPGDFYITLSQFTEYIEKNKISKKDVTSYSSLEEMRAEVSLASFKELDKELETQVIKEFENDRWIIVRPLTFSSSAKYGASTRWCTTYQKEKEYFEKYWRKGILIYVINKQSGYKFAGFKSLCEDRELSLWAADDRRIDLLEAEIDDYLYPVLVKIFKSDDTNKNLCSPELQELVHQECIPEFEKKMYLSDGVPTQIRIPEGIFPIPSL